MGPCASQCAQKYAIGWEQCMVRSRPCVESFFHSSVGVDTQIYICNAMLLSQGLFQSSTWPELYGCEFSIVHTSIMRIYRAFLSDPYLDGVWESDDFFNFS